MVHPGRYRDAHPSPESHAYDIAGGERSILAQYLEAIGRRASLDLYREPGDPDSGSRSARWQQPSSAAWTSSFSFPPIRKTTFSAARQNPQRKPLFDGLAALGRYENFALCGIAGVDARGRRSAIYVHSKIMLVDDACATIGSCNLHANSLAGHTEMNASIWDPQGRARPALRTAGRASRPGHRRHRRPISASPLPGNRA